MERFKSLAEDGIIFAVMGILSIMKELLAKDEPIEWGKIFTKFFINLVSGVGVYSFLLSYKEWYGEYPQKIGVIMFATYTGSKVIDLVVDKVYVWIKNGGIKEIIRKILDL